jgi:hypothetical protein
MTLPPGYGWMPTPPPESGCATIIKGILALVLVLGTVFACANYLGSQ